MRVIWKDEGGVGPVVVTDKPAPPADASFEELSRPYQPKCVCRIPLKGELNEWGYPVCRACGGEVEHWVSRAQARRIAKTHGVELEET